MITYTDSALVEAFRMFVIECIDYDPVSGSQILIAPSRDSVVTALETIREYTK
jgi:hypothetical protein